MSQAESERYVGDESTYVPLSKTAVVALLLALAAAGSVINSLLAFLGPMAIATSLMALYVFRRKKGALRGRKLAVVALCLSFLFTSWGLTRMFCHRWWLYRHADQYTRDWVKWIEEGKLAQAFAHTRGAGAKNPYTGQVEAFEGEEFFKSEPIKSIRSGKGRLTKPRYLGILETPSRAYVRISYEYVIEEEDGEERIVPVMVELMRSYHADRNRYNWYVNQVN